MRRVERDNVKHRFFLEHKLCTAARSPQEKVGDGPLSNSFLEGTSGCTQANASNESSQGVVRPTQMCKSLQSGLIIHR